jgi:hypothetical protein
MTPLPKPRFQYDYEVEHELAALRDYPKLPDRADRTVPAKRKSRLLLALGMSPTWVCRSGGSRITG